MRTKLRPLFSGHMKNTKSQWKNVGMSLRIMNPSHNATKLSSGFCTDLSKMHEYRAPS